MSPLLAEVERQAKALPSEERALLVESLLESLEEVQLSEIAAAWRREIDERVSSYDRGELETHAAEEVFAEARHIAR